MDEPTKDTLPDGQPLVCPLPQNGQRRGSAVSRRNFLRIGMGTLGALALIEVGGASFFFFRSRSLEGEYGGIIKAGSVEDFPHNSVTEFADSHFFLIRAADGGFLAVHNRCTHLGCLVNWVPEDNEFICPCHAATFDFYGVHRNPPVPRPLDTFPVEFDEGLIRVDTSQPQQRERFAPEQLAYSPAGSSPEESS
jgi:cytochrome b6-f complex iron-sulfur subunit